MLHCYLFRIPTRSQNKNVGARRVYQQTQRHARKDLGRFSDTLHVRQALYVVLGQVPIWRSMLSRMHSWFQNLSTVYFAEAIASYKEASLSHKISARSSLSEGVCC